jgi:hypothetical protein
MTSATAMLSFPLAESTSSQVSTVLHAVAPIIWPLVVILAILVFRVPLAAAIGHIREIDAGSTKVTFQKQADNAASTTKAVVGTRKPTPASLSTIADAEAKVTADPSGSILTAWRAVEDAARFAPNKPLGVISPSVPAAINALAANKGLNSAMVPAAEALESLRGVAASQPKAITAATAMSFVSAASDLASIFGGLEVDRIGGADASKISGIDVPGPGELGR